MQSGTTGINSIRIYNPIKQGVDHDPDGTFIREWVPELADMQQEFIHTPWKAPSQMNDYRYLLSMKKPPEKLQLKSSTDYGKIPHTKK